MKKWAQRPRLRMSTGTGPARPGPLGGPEGPMAMGPWALWSRKADWFEESVEPQKLPNRSTIRIPLVRPALCALIGYVLVPNKMNMNANIFNLTATQFLSHIRGHKNGNVTIPRTLHHDKEREPNME